MPTALITGSPERAEAVAGVLRANGFSTRCSPYGLPLVAASASIPDSSLACYVQVPDEQHWVGKPTTDGELRASVVRDLLNRFDALGVVAPLLAPEATTFVLPGHDADTVLFLILAGAVLGHHGAVSVTTVVTSEDALSTAIAGAWSVPRADVRQDAAVRSVDPNAVRAGCLRAGSEQDPGNGLAAHLDDFEGPTLDHDAVSRPVGDPSQTVEDESHHRGMVARWKVGAELGAQVDGKRPGDHDGVVVVQIGAQHRPVSVSP